MDSKKQRDLDDLNKVLKTLREAADPETGILFGSCVETTFRNHPEFTLSRIKYLIQRLSALGWRETIFIGSPKKIASKLRFQPQLITSLVTLPEVVKKRDEQARLLTDIVHWVRTIRWRNNEWIITPETGEPIAVRLGAAEKCAGHDDVTMYCHKIKLLSPLSTLPDWLKKLLTSKGRLGRSKLYALATEGRAKQKQ